MTAEEFFGKYKYDVVTSKIGSGRLGTVYKAYDLQEYNFVALKIAEVKTYKDKRLCLADEIRKISFLPEHPNHVKYTEAYTFQQATGTFDFAIMPYFQAGNLQHLITNHLLTQSEKENIALQILDGLEFLHRQNIIHSNLKPSNILFEIKNSVDGSEYTVKITDFGLSELYENTGISGLANKDLLFCNPEKLKGESIQANSDLWSWAVICYQLFTGKELFASENQVGDILLMKSILEDDISHKLSDLPENWKIALYDALIKDPTQRIQSAAELKKILSENQFERDNFTQEETVEFDEEDEEEYEVQIEDEPTPVFTPPPSPNPSRSATKVISAPVETNENPKRKTWIWLVVLLALLAAGYYAYNNLELFGNNLSEKKAKAILIKMMDIRSQSSFDEVSDVFANTVDKYFSEDDISRKNIVADMEKFAKSWNFENVKIVDFGRTVENMFHFTMTYNLRDKKSLQITPYRVNGEVGFVKENELFKINYITNRGVASDRMTFNYGIIPVRKQQDFNDYYLTYNASLLYLPDVKDDYLLNYIYSDLLSVKPAGYQKAQIQKAIQDDYIEFINEAEKQMAGNWADSTLTFSKQIEMSTAFVDANFLSLQVVQNITYGHPVQVFSVQYKNLDYADGKVLALNDVINVNAVSWPDIIQKAFRSKAVTASGKQISEENIGMMPAAPGNFYFDTKKIFFVYGVEEIPEVAFLGPITVAVPLEDMENYLSSYFKGKIFNSGKVNVKKI